MDSIPFLVQTWLVGPSAKRLFQTWVLNLHGFAQFVEKAHRKRETVPALTTFLSPKLGGTPQEQFALVVPTCFILMRLQTQVATEFTAAPFKFLLTGCQMGTAVAVISFRKSCFWDCWSRKRFARATGVVGFTFTLIGRPKMTKKTRGLCPHPNSLALVTTTLSSVPTYIFV